MTKNERWVALLNREPMDRIPVLGAALGFAVVNAGLSIVDFYNDPQKSYDAQMRIADKFGFQEIPWIAYAAIGGWEFGGDIKWPSGDFAQAPTVLKHPVETEEDVWNLKVPDISTAGIIPLMTKIAKLVEKSGSPYIWCFVQGPFTTATNLPGADKLAKWMLKKPDVAHRLLRLVTDFQIGVAQYWADTFDPKRIITYEAEPAASNQVISPKQFEQFAFPYIKEVHERTLATGIKHIHMHICGEQNENYPYWAQAPMGDPGIISVSQEVDLEKAIKYFPNDIIVGNIEPATIQTGTPQEVYELSRKIIEKGRKAPGGFMLAPGCELPPKSPPENVRMIMKAINDFGWYE
ncbi:Uroporphyrinogen decarboxylase [subsurface metagenome]